MNHQELTIKVTDIHLDQKNPRFPPITAQREAIDAMLADQGDKIATLALDIYQNGLNPSSKLILFKAGAHFVDGDGNRRLTALKILETPSLANAFPKLRKRIDAILKSSGAVPTEVGCVVFSDRNRATSFGASPTDCTGRWMRTPSATTYFFVPPNRSRINFVASRN